MKNKKKTIVILACALCLMATAAVAASGKIASYQVSSSGPENAEYKNFEDLKKAKKDMGFDMKLVETFENGAQFRQGHLANVLTQDAQGNAVESYPELMMFYQLNDKKVNLSVSKPAVKGEETPWDKVITFEGVTMKYVESNYLFLPPNTTPSQADVELEQQGKLYISYGSDKEERMRAHFLVWQDQGIDYSLLSWDVGESDLFSMGQQLIGQ